MANLTIEEAGKNLNDALRELSRAFKNAFTKKYAPKSGKLYEEIIAGDNSSILLKGHIYDGPVIILSDRPEIIKHYKSTIRGTGVSIPIVRNGTEEIIGMCEIVVGANSIDVSFVDGANVTRMEFFKMFGCGCFMTEIEQIPDGEGETDFNNFIIKRAKINSFRWEPV